MVPAPVSDNAWKRVLAPCSGLKPRAHDIHGIEHASAAAKADKSIHASKHAGAIAKADKTMVRPPAMTAEHPWHSHLADKSIVHSVDSVAPQPRFPSTMHVVFCQGAAVAYPRYIVTYKPPPDAAKT